MQQLDTCEFQGWLAYRLIPDIDSIYVGKPTCERCRGKGVVRFPRYLGGPCFCTEDVDDLHEVWEMAYILIRIGRWRMK